MRLTQVHLSSALVWIAVLAALMGFWQLWPKGGLVGPWFAVIFEFLVAIVLVTFALMLIGLQKKRRPGPREIDQ